MKYTPLSLVQQRVELGQPLPFNIRDHDGTLLLARGQQVDSLEQQTALLARGALVDLAELRDSAEAVHQARSEDLPELWHRCMDRLGRTLMTAPSASFVAALDQATPPVLALIARDPDLAIFQVLRQHGNAHQQYGVNHSMHAAITGLLVAQRLGWTDIEAQRVFKAALTMNLSMLALQGELALQTAPPTPAQRAEILAHPESSRRALELSGVTDGDWLDAVSQHHENEDGSGYPSGLRQPGDIAALLRRADLYTAKLSPRSSREAISADKAGRMMFMQEPDHPMTAALVKEFGVYPPGCFVRLMSGETGLVVRRGASVMSPIVAVLTSPYGNGLVQPLRRDSADPAYAVHSVLGPHQTGLRVTPEALMAVATA